VECRQVTEDEDEDEDEKRSDERKVRRREYGPPRAWPVGRQKLNGRRVSSRVRLGHAYLNLGPQDLWHEAW